MCRSKDEGGLEIKDLRCMNMTLLKEMEKLGSEG